MVQAGDVVRAAAEITVNREGEGCDRDAGTGTAQLGVTGETAHENDMVQHEESPLRFDSDDDGAQDTVGDLEHTVQLSGELGLAFAVHQDIVAFG